MARMTYAQAGELFRRALRQKDKEVEAALEAAAEQDSKLSELLERIDYEEKERRDLLTATALELHE